MQAIILAAGASSRFWPLNPRSKFLFRIMGKPIIWYVVEGLRKLEITDIVIVQCPNKDVEQALEQYGFDIKYVVQEKPVSSGSAILEAEDLINDHFLVLNGERIDVEDSVKPLLDKLESLDCEEKCVILAGKTDRPWLFGILETKDDKVKSLIEKPEKGKEPSDLKVVGTYLFPKCFFEYLKKVEVHPHSLEHAILLYAKEKDVRVALTEKETIALKFPWDLFSFNKYLMD
ncbi:MAG: sugar phosphate nucleotidyltransferase, partial [Patescibacteria group bacterium]